MAGRAITQVFGKVFGLSTENPIDENKQIVYLIWNEIDAYELNVCQMKADDALVELELARKDIDLCWPEEGETIGYGPVITPTMEENTINVYVCSSGHRLITRDGNSVTTPLTITCRQCEAEDERYVAAYSSYYYVDQSLQPTHEWYKPKFADRIPDPHTRDHCRRGGLLLREVGQGDYTIDLPAPPRHPNRPERFLKLGMRALTNRTGGPAKQ